MRSREKGFSLVELMVTVAIIAILGTISFSIYAKHKARSYRAQAQPCVSDIAIRLENYRSNHGEYSASNSWPALQITNECGTHYAGAYRVFDDGQRYVVAYRGIIWKGQYDVWAICDVSNTIYHLEDPIDGKTQVLPVIELADGTKIDYNDYRPF